MGLKTGDYTRGLEKFSHWENYRQLAMNLGKKRKAFEAEIERMSDFPGYIFASFIDDLMNFPENLNT